MWQVCYIAFNTFAICQNVCMYVYAHPADDDEYMSKHTYGHELVLPNQHLVHVAADDDFVVSKHTYGHMFVLPS